MNTISRRTAISALAGTAAAATAATSVSTRPAAAAGSTTSIDLLVPPLRVEDTRDGGVKVSAHSPVEIFVPGLIADDVVGAIFNVTIVETEGAGFLVLDAGAANAANTTSNINWSSSGLILANLAMIPAHGTRGITVRAGGAGRTHLVLDVIGFLVSV